MLRWLRRFIILCVALGLMAAAGVGLSYWWKQQSSPKFLTATLSRGRVETVVNSTGTIKPVQTVSVGSFVSGPIAKIKAEFNDVVHKGDELAVIDTKLLQAAVDRDEAAWEAQKADLARAQALLDQAVDNQKRALELHKVNADYLTSTELEQYDIACRTAKAQKDLSEQSVNQAYAQLQNSRENLGYAHIKSPVNGIVIERKVDEGQTVAASFQTPELFSIGVDMDKHVDVFASVDEADIGLIREAQAKGRPVSFTVDAYPGELFGGKIDQVRYNSTTTQNVVTYPVVIEADNPDLKLMPGMTADISFQVEDRNDVLRLPVAALRYVPPAGLVRPEDRHYVEGVAAADSNAPPSATGTAADKAEKAKSLHNRHVWVRDGELLRAVPVTLGLIDFQNAEVVGGDLAEGQEVVTGIDNLFGPR